MTTVPIPSFEINALSHESRGFPCYGTEKSHVLIFFARNHDAFVKFGAPFRKLYSERNTVYIKRVMGNAVVHRERQARESSSSDWYRSK